MPAPPWRRVAPVATVPNPREMLARCGGLRWTIHHSVTE